MEALGVVRNNHDRGQRKTGAVDICFSGDK